VGFDFAHIPKREIRENKTNAKYNDTTVSKMIRIGNHKNNNYQTYSRTYIKQPPKGVTKSGCLTQVAVEEGKN
jgi:hypothetical protein